MNFNSFTDDVFAPRDIRRYPSDLDRVPDRGTTKRAEGGRRMAFSEFAAGMNGTTRGDPTSSEPPAAKNGKPFALWEKEAFGFADFIDMINPLHHIPIVATIYRNLSGDQIGVAPRVIGGAFWGQIGGLVAGVANAAVEWWSGKDIGDHIYAAMFGPANKDVNAAAVVQKKVMPSVVARGELVAREAPKPRSGDNPIATSAETPPAAPPQSNAVDPAALRSETPTIFAPAVRTARNSYERNRNWDEPDESLGVRFPA